MWNSLISGRKMHLVGILISLLTLINTGFSVHIFIKTPKITAGHASLEIICEVKFSEKLTEVKSIQLLRNESAVMTPVVTIENLEVAKGTTVIRWQDSHLRARGTCTGDVSAETPFLKFSIPRQHVHCDDARAYKCKLIGIKGKAIPFNEEIVKFQPVLCPSRYLKIHSPHPSIILGQNPLEIKCDIFKTANLLQVINIDLLRNSSKSYQNILSVSSQVNGPSAIVWQDKFLQSRATASGDVSTTSAFMRFRLHSKQVKCADAATYTCRMTAMLNDYSTRYEEVTIDIATRARPNSLESLTISPPADSKRKHRVGTGIQMMCSGIFGNPPENLRWCFKRHGESIFREYPLKSDIVYSDAVSSGYCQYKRSSTLSFTIHQEDDKAEFLCEVYNTGSCGTSMVQTKYMLQIRTNATAEELSGSWTTEELEDIGKLIALGVLTALVVILIVLLVVSIVLLIRCKRQRSEENKRRIHIEHTDHDEPEKQPIFDNDKPDTTYRGDYSKCDVDEPDPRHSAV